MPDDNEQTVFSKTKAAGYLGVTIHFFNIMERKGLIKPFMVTGKHPRTRSSYTKAALDAIKDKV